MRINLLSSKLDGTVACTCPGSSAEEHQLSGAFAIFTVFFFV